MDEQLRTRLEWGAVAAGAAIALVLLSGWIVGGGSATAPARVTLVAERSTDLDVTQVTGPLGVARLRPGAPALRRTIDARNATGAALEVSLRAAPDDRGLDAILVLRLRARGATLFEGSLARLRASGSTAFLLASHDRVRVEVSAWLPRGAKGYGARDETIPLRFVTTAPVQR